MGRDQNININRCLEEVGSSPHKWLGRVQISVEEGTADVVETRETGSEVEPEDVTELLQSHKAWMDEKSLLTDEQRQWFLEVESAPGEDAVKIAADINLADKAA